MDPGFTSEEKAIWKEVRRFAREALEPNLKTIEQEGQLPPAVKAKLFSMELLKTPFPEDVGGAGGSFTAFILILKTLAQTSMVPAWMLFENFILAYPLVHYGSDFLREAYLPRLLSLESTGALAFTEPETGSDPSSLQTVAEKAEGGWRINGTKRFITHSSCCDQAILFAREGDLVHAFLVNRNQKGFIPGRREEFLHARGIDNGDIYLENYFAPEDHLIGNPGQGFEILLRTEAIGKIAFCSFFIGMAEKALDLAVKYATTRMHRSKPIGHKFQLTQFKLARMLTKTEAMKAYLAYICRKADQGEDIFFDAAALKLLVAEEIKSITADAMEIHGAYGLSADYEIGRLYQAAISAQVVMGSLDIQRVIVAKGLLARKSG